mmetsp:Transcript_78170/g.137987  ORF Transcript_78170/g.137987 Transcript_78170/m.137987 type:complete len:263 (+) Transcript_78170:1055-1843(+)
MTCSGISLARRFSRRRLRAGHDFTICPSSICPSPSWSSPSISARAIWMSSGEKGSPILSMKSGTSSMGMVVSSAFPLLCSIAPRMFVTLALTMRLADVDLGPYFFARSTLAALMSAKMVAILRCIPSSTGCSSGLNGLRDGRAGGRLTPALYTFARCAAARSLACCGVSLNMSYALIFTGAASGGGACSSVKVTPACMALSPLGLAVGGASEGARSEEERPDRGPRSASTRSAASAARAASASLAWSACLRVWWCCKASAVS